VTRRLSYSDVPDGIPYVSVYCSGRAGPGGVPGHQDRPWRIASFYPDDELPPWPDGSTRWSEVIHNYWAADRKVIVLNTAPTRVGMVGNRVVTQDEWQANPAVFDQGSRSRYKLACGTCGLALAAREKKLESSLDRLLGHGINEVSLAALAAMISFA
jgi:hypothetical protein